MSRKKSKETPVRDLAILTQTDLELIVQYEEQDPPTLIYRLEVQNPLLGLVHERTSRKRIRDEAFGQIESLFKTIGDWPASDDPDRQAKSIRRLGSIGADLFRELVPERLGDKLRHLACKVHESRQGSAPVTLQIHSSETFIPWELLKFPSDDGQGPYLVEAFALTRWLDGCTQVLELPLYEIALVMADSELEAAKPEGEFVRSLGGGDRKVVDLPARTNAIVEHLADGRADALHIIGHGAGVARGENPNLWALRLEAGDELHAYDLRDGARRFGQKLPLIFANACHSGRGALSLSRTGGLAAAFLEAGAGAFVGTHWAIRDHQACHFTQAFYEHFLKDDLALGEAVMRARMALRESSPGDPTWLAYTVYGHPLASARTPAATRITIEATAGPSVSPLPGLPEKQSARREPLPAARSLISMVPAAPDSPRQSRPWVRTALVCALAIALLGAIFWSWHHSNMRQRAVVLNNAGFVLLQEGQVKEACEKFQTALNLVPDFVESIANLARCTELAGDVPKALTLYRRAVALRPDDALHRFNLGAFLASREQYDEAIRELRRAIELRPAYVEAHNELGNVYYALGYFEEAIDLLSQALGFEEQIDSATASVLHKNLARALLRVGRAAEAMSHLEIALKNFDIGSARHREVVYLLATAHDQMGDGEKACEYLAQLAGLVGSDLDEEKATAARALAERNGCASDVRSDGTSRPQSTR